LWGEFVWGFDVLFLSFVCVSVSVVLFSVGVCACVRDLLIFLQDGNLVARKRKKSKKRKQKNAQKKQKSGGDAAGAEATGEEGATQEGATQEGGTQEGATQEGATEGEAPAAEDEDTGGESEGDPEFELQETALDFEHELYQFASDRSIVKK